MKNKWFYGLFLVLAVLIGIYYVQSTDVTIDSNDTSNDGDTITEDIDSDENTEINTDNTEEIVNTIFVHICGEVVNEGVYETKEDSRVYEVVELAGGLTDDAATDYVNLARQVKDGEQINFPSKEQIETGEVSIDNLNETLVNINTASIDRLVTLSGIGESRAKLIIDYREEHGDFQSIEDIMKVSGIKEGAFNKIKDSIIVK